MKISNKIDRENIQDILPLTPLQEGILYHYLKEPESDVYFEQLSLNLVGEINIEVFERAWNFIICTNEMLRTMFRWENLENPIQVVLKEHMLKPVYYDVSNEDHHKPGKSLKEIKARDKNEKFHLREVPFRVSLGKIEKNRYELIVSNHHILYDGWATGIILKEFFHAYHHLSKGKELVLPVKTKFKEFIKWVQNQDTGKQEKFWTGYLQGFNTPGELSIKRKNKETTGIGNCCLTFAGSVQRELESFVGKYKVTMASVLYSAWGLLLQKYNSSDDVIFGTTVSGRTAKVPGIENMVGLFINTIPLRVQTGPHENIGDLLNRVNTALQKREEYDHTPLVNIKESSEMGNEEEFFDTIVVIENYPLDSSLVPEPGTFSLDSFSMEEKTHYDLTVGITIFADLKITFSYHREKFDEDSIGRLANHFRGMIETIIDDPGKKIPTIEIISPEEKKQVLYDFNDTGAEFPKNKTIHRLFTGQVEKTPDNIAIASPRQLENSTPGTYMTYISYSQLNEKSHRLAHLLKEKGVEPGTIVGIMVESPVKMVIGILGILIAGGAYLPIDPDSPQERIAYMLTDSNVKALVVGDTSRTSCLSFAPKAQLNLSEGHHLNFPASQLPSFPASLPFSLAYIIYTSGSTGKPKGVPITHANFSPLVHWGYKNLGINTKDRVIQNLSYYFDWSVWEMFITLTSGAALYMITGDIRLNPEPEVDFILENAITVLHITPTQFRYLIDIGKKLTTLKYLFIGAEKFTVQLLEQSKTSVNEDCRIFNMYGPTEATIISSVLEIDPSRISEYERCPGIPIGRPVGNTVLLVQDREFNWCPIGIPGELVIAGDALSQGYLNNPALTAAKFCLRRPGGRFLKKLPPWTPRKNFSLKVPGKDYMHPCNHATMPLTTQHSPLTIYRTGDWARWLSDGNIEFLGRMDYQVKIRGYRIEPGEIENQILKHPEIKETLVMSRQYVNSENYLCAYVVPHDPSYLGQSSCSLALIDRIKEQLSAQLPGYMVPAHVVLLEKMPLNPNGKVDSKTLPTPGMTGEQKYTAPRNTVEMELVRIWIEVLAGNEDKAHLKIGIDDSFFEMGGHSLKANTLVSKIHKKLDVKIPLAEIFKRKTIRRLAEYIREAVETKYSGIEPVEKKEFYSLSSAQKRLYVLQQMEAGNIGYNELSILELTGELDRLRFEETSRKLISRHESLRTSFILIEDEPVQKINKEVEFKIEYYEVKVEEEPSSRFEGTGGLAPLSLPATRNPQPATALISSFIRPFDLSRAPLLRLGLIKLLHPPAAPRGHPRQDIYNSQEGKEDRYLLMLDIHHIIIDGISQGIFIKDFISIYQGEKLPILSIQYKDFAGWQNSGRHKTAIKRQGEYWLKEFNDEIPVLNLPFDFVRPPVQSFQGSSIEFKLDSHKTCALKKLAGEERATLFMVLLAIYNIFLSKISSQEDIIIGTPISGRRHEDLQPVIGMFVNTLALRNLPNGEKSSREFLNQLREKTLEAFENQDYQFEDLVEQAAVHRDASRNPIFDVMFVLQNMERSEINLPGLKLNQYDYEKSISKFDLALLVWEAGNHLRLIFEYSTKLFKKETIQRLIGYFTAVVSGVLEKPTKKISAIEIISGEEKKKLLHDFNNTWKDYPQDKTIAGLFEHQAAKKPGNTALAGPTAIKAIKNRSYMTHKTYISYQELNEKSNRLAHLLIEKGVGPDTIVGIMVERSLEMIIGILGILKAGGAYLPLDPDYPQDRIDYMLKDSGAGILLTGQEIAGLYSPQALYLSEGHHLNFPASRLPSFPASLPSSLAYIMYTSGSTGKPKGVMLEHRNLVNLLNYQFDYTNIDFSKVLQFTTISFDVSFQEIFSTLAAGGTLVLIDKDTRHDIPRLFKTIEENDIKTLFLPASYLKFVISEENYIGLMPGNVKHIVIAGEQVVITDELRRYLRMNRIYFHNHYGPTESHVVTTLTLGPDEDLPRLPSIGKPVVNTAIYIMNSAMHLVPIGVPGELVIGGIQVGRGYLNRPGLTAEKFDQDLWDYHDYHDKEAPFGQIKNAFGEKNRKVPGKGIQGEGIHRSYQSYRSYIYKTGDLARWQSDGNIEFLGRIDHQIKIRGFRVELGEIESRLLNHPEIKETVVLAQKDEQGNINLCAYIVTGKELIAADLREYLAISLPGYMIPSYFMRIDKIPLNPNGKIDRKALPEPGIKKGEDVVAPRNALEKKLVEIWRGVLGPGISVGSEDNFFELGGHSLKGTVLIFRIHREFNTGLLLVDLFKYPTVRSLARYLREKGIADTDSLDKFIAVEPAAKQEYYALSPAQKQLYVLQQMDLGSTTYNMPMVVRLKGQLENEKLEFIFKTLIARHESFRTSFVPQGKETVQKIHPEVEFEIEYDQSLVNGHWSLENCQARGEVSSPIKVEEERSSRLEGTGGLAPLSFAPLPTDITPNIIKNFIRPFDLSRAPLLRVGLIKLPHTSAALHGYPRRGTYKSQEENKPEHILMVDMHHIISDGVTLEIFINEFMALYRGETLPQLRLQYKDFSCWRNRLLQSGVLQKQKEFWLKRFKGKLPILNMPLDFPRPRTRGSEGDTRTMPMDEGLLARVKKHMRRGGTTIYQFLLAVYNVLLYKYTGQTDIIVGSPVSGRRHADLEGIVGVFVNMLAIRNYPGPGKSFAEFLEEVKMNALAAHENQDYPFDELVNQLGLQGKPGRNPVFDVGFLYNTLDARKIKDPHLEIIPYEVRHQVSRFDMLMAVLEDSTAIAIQVEYSTRLFKSTGIHGFLKHYMDILRQVTENLNIKLENIEIETGLKAIASKKPEIQFAF